jgi:MFS family permease
MTSWGAVGFQLGIFLSTIECFLLEKFLSPEALVAWGWRLSFGIGGLIGLFGLALRSRLHETPLFVEITSHLRVVKEPLREMFKHKRGMIKAFFYSLLCSSGFYLFTVNFPIYFGKNLGLSFSDNLLIVALLLLAITVPLPMFGKLADKYDYKKMLIYSTIGMLVLLYPIYVCMVDGKIFLMIFISFLFCILYACMTSLMPYIFCNLFPTNNRFTCVSTSFNLSDALAGGFTPVLGLYLLELTGDPGSFCWILLTFGILSLISFFMVKDIKHHDDFDVA